MGIKMIEMFFGHLIGDYFLQNKWMAKSKTKYNGLGWSICFIHCLLYTLSVCVFMWDFRMLWILIIFFSHFFVDKFSLAEKYLRLIKGRSLEIFLDEEDKVTPYVALRAGFNVLVYTVCDNTMHLLIMYYGYSLI